MHGGTQGSTQMYTETQPKAYSQGHTPDSPLAPHPDRDIHKHRYSLRSTQRSIHSHAHTSLHAEAHSHTGTNPHK